jgi:hypothetical protein
MVDRILRGMAKEFDGLCAKTGRPGRLLRVALLQLFYSVRSERLFLCRCTRTCSSAGSSCWSWTSCFGIMRCFPRPGSPAEPGARAGVLSTGIGAGENALSDEHFTVDGTLIEAWAGQKCFQEGWRRRRRTS